MALVIDFRRFGAADIAFIDDAYVISESTHLQERQ
jgi:hypothetical protein